MRFKKIIAAVDLDDDLVADVIAAASSLAAKDNAKLEVVSVWPPITAVTPAFSGEMAASSATMSQAVMDQHRAGRQETQDKLAKLTAQLSSFAAPVVIDGEPADAVAEYAKKADADLIVTGSHQRSFWGALLQGSASRELVHEAPCAVFLVTKTSAARLREEKSRG